MLTKNKKLDILRQTINDIGNAVGYPCALHDDYSTKPWHPSNYSHSRHIFELQCELKGLEAKLNRLLDYLGLEEMRPQPPKTTITKKEPK